MRTCNYDGCDNRLHIDNQSGYCRQHVQKVNRDEANAANRRSYRKLMESLSADEKRRRKLLSRYGITQDDYDNLVLCQYGLCPVCGESLPDPSSISETPHVDHDKECCPGEGSCGNCVRGILHGNCNRELGKLESFRKRDWSAFDNYLNKWGKINPIKGA